MDHDGIMWWTKDEYFPRGHVPQRTLHHYFLCILAVTTALCLLTELLFTSRQTHRLPAYTLRQRYVLSAITDNRRTGNLMFNLASVIGIAKRHNMTAIMPADFKLRYIFDMNVTAGDENTLKMYMDHIEYGRRACAYDIRTERLGEPFSWRLLGYYQSWMYFRDAEPEVRSQLQFKPDIHHAAQHYLQQHISTNLQLPQVVRIGIHIRRGDHSEPHFASYGYTTADSAYFKRAMDHFTTKYKQVVFIVCSDDIPWSEANIDATIYPIIFSHSGDAAIDLAILVSCEHIIMSVGSYGWWAGWLAGGDVVYYKDWPKPYSRLEYDINKKQYFPPHWLPL